MSSLDRGLRMLQMVRDGGPLRVSEAALELGISRPSAHRALRALAKREFLEQDESRRYVAGPALRAAPLLSPLGGRVRRASIDHLDWLSLETGHSSNLMVRVGSDVRFLACRTVHGGTPDRTGLIMPAHVTAGGQAMLALFDDESLQRIYTHAANGHPARPPAIFRHTLDDARRRGYAAAARPEAHLSAIGVAVAGEEIPAGRAALTVSVPTDTLPRDVEELAIAVREAARRLGSDLRVA